MKLNPLSKKYIDLIASEEHSFVKLTPNTKTILSGLYASIQQAYRMTNNKFEQYIKENFLSHETKHIDNSSTVIQMPEQFKEDRFPAIIYKKIHESTKTQLFFKFAIGDRTYDICISVVLKDVCCDDYKRQIELIINWLLILNKYVRNDVCANNVSIYIFMTDLPKYVPAKESNIVLDWEHINTGFTWSCKQNTEIIIYREEEWFKTLIHETFHAYGLDFSETYEPNMTVSNLFGIGCKILLFESYVEFWAEIMNSLFFLYYDKKTSLNIFVEEAEKILNLERTHSVVQMCKILSYNKISYCDMIANNKTEKYKNMLLKYKEKTNVFAYFVIKTILYVHINETFDWFSLYNVSSSIIQFDNSNDLNSKRFEELIYKLYNSTEIKGLVKKYERIVARPNYDYNNKSAQFALYNFNV